jgi:hypothetical protein
MQLVFKRVTAFLATASLGSLGLPGKQVRNPRVFLAVRAHSVLGHLEASGQDILKRMKVFNLRQEEARVPAISTLPLSWGHEVERQRQNWLRNLS